VFLVPTIKSPLVAPPPSVITLPIVTGLLLFSEYPKPIVAYSPVEPLFLTNKPVSPVAPKVKLFDSAVNPPLSVPLFPLAILMPLLLR